jgi:hypothetical protein
MRRFLILIYLMTALIHVPVALAAHEALRRAGVPSAGWIALTLACVLAALMRGRMPRAVMDRPIPTWKRLLVEEPYFAHWCAAFACTPLFAPGLVMLALASIAGLSELSLAAVGTVALAAYATGLALAVWGVVVRRRWVRVREIEIALDDLPKAFDGYRVAHLSDLHIGSHCPRSRAEGWVARVNRLDVDLAVLTGDYVSSGVAFHEDIARVLVAIRAKDGTVAVMGNHDYFGDGEPLIGLLRKGGVRVLRNERMSLERNGERVTLAGVDDTWTRRANISKTLDGHHPGEPLVVLAHDPKLFPELARRGAALVLSGHTHWGQVAVPFLSTRYNFSRLSYRYHSGIYREGGSTLYIHPGLGTTGPPIRLGVAPEITVLRLRAAG